MAWGIVQLPTLLDDMHIRSSGYPLESVVAEKTETMISRGDANIRMRDYADVYLISQRHSLTSGKLQSALEETAAHREAELIALSAALVNFVEDAIRWTRSARFGRSC